MVAAVSSLVRTRPAWCFGGATGLAAIATVVAVVGHPHGKVEARDIGQNPQSRSGSHPPQTIPVKPSQPAFATVSLKGAPAPASGPARAPLPPFVPKPADRTTNVSFATASGGASGPAPSDG